MRGGSRCGCPGLNPTPSACQTMQKYYIEIMAMKCNFSLEIDEERFSILKFSKDVLTHALAIEEKYEILISNYIELEKQVTNEIIAHMAMRSIECQDDFKTLISLNIKMVNLLTSTRLYTDQLLSHISFCLSDRPEIKEKIKGLFSTEYDSNFEYRFMEALRNYVQHKGLAVHNGSHKKGWKNNYSRLEYSLYFSAKKSELALDKNFKKSILDEMPDEVDLHSASRSYVESMSRVHEQTRHMINEVVEKSRLAIEIAREDFKKAYPDKNMYFLSACAYKNEHRIDEIPLPLEWDDIRRKLIMRNKGLARLGKSCLFS